MLSREDIISEITDLFTSLDWSSWSARQDVAMILGEVCNYPELELIRNRIKTLLEGE